MAALPSPSLSRLERLVKVVGERNLPPKLPPTVTQSESNSEANENDTLTDPFNNLQSVDDFIAEEGIDNWWDPKPLPPKPVNQVNSQQSGTAPTAASYVSVMTNSRMGEPAPLGVGFTPFLAVTKLPYKFVKKQFMQPIATAFFDENKIYNREWDIYYIWSDYAPTAKPVTFVPEHQLLALVTEINAAFPRANVHITDELRESGLVINFDECPALRPRWLGQTTNRAEYIACTENLEMPKQGQMTDGRSLQAFREKMELATEIAKNKSKAAKAKRQVENFANRQNMARSLLRAQRYLGMLGKSEDSLLPDIASISLSPIDYTTPSQHPFEQDAIFIAVDVEAYERPPRMITEVGVATLDTRDLLHKAPSKVGEDWQEAIRARHFRIAEYKHYVNTEFVSGCPDKFEFGKSEFVGKDAIGQTLASCFKPPYSNADSGNVDEKRNIILVGHDVSQDINYLQSIGFNILNSGNLIDKIDTAELFRVHTRDPNPRSLGSILYEFDLAGWHLHNAGNDAAYTIWAMLAVSVKAASDRGSEEERKKRDGNLEKRTEAAIEQAKQKVQDEFDGWDTKDHDGGMPVSPSEDEQKRRVKKSNGESNRGLYTIGGAVLDV